MLLATSRGMMRKGEPHNSLANTSNVKSRKEWKEILKGGGRCLTCGCQREPSKAKNITAIRFSKRVASSCTSLLRPNRDASDRAQLRRIGRQCMWYRTSNSIVTCGIRLQLVRVKNKPIHVHSRKQPQGIEPLGMSETPKSLPQFLSRGT